MKNKKNLAQPRDHSANKTNKTRRKVLTGALATGAVVAWQKPIIESVIMPAHAQTSTAASSPATRARLAFFGGGGVIVQNSPNVPGNILDFFVSSAVAGQSIDPPNSAMASLVQSAGDANTFAVSLLLEFSRGFGPRMPQFVFSGNLTVGGSGTLTLSENPCNITTFNPSISVELLSINTIARLKVSASFVSGSFIVEIPQGTGSLPTAVCNMGNR